jgi:HEAT repeat protein
MATKRGKVSKSDLIALLHAEDYCGARRLGARAIAALKRIVRDGDWNLAAKATYLAGLINDESSIAVIELAAKSRKPAVRVAAASAAAHLSPDRAEPILLRLLQSKDVGIRKIALKATGQSMTDKVRLQVQRVLKQESIRDMKSLAASVLKTPAIG